MRSETPAGLLPGIFLAVDATMKEEGITLTSAETEAVQFAARVRGGYGGS